MTRKSKSKTPSAQAVDRAAHGSPWATVDWRKTDAVIAQEMGVSRQRAHVQRRNLAGGTKAVKPRKTRREMDEKIDEIVGCVSYYDPRTAEELSYNQGVRDMANTFRGWTLRGKANAASERRTGENLH